MPPTMRRFRYNSVAMRRYISRSSALCRVTNGWAIAPAGMGTSTGVSTSRKPRASKKARMAEMMRLRARIVSCTSRLEIRSR